MRYTQAHLVDRRNRIPPLEATRVGFLAAAALLCFVVVVLDMPHFVDRSELCLPRMEQS